MSGRSGTHHIVTIDGPAGVGKSTAARALAERLGFFLLDTGALYRCVALHLMRLGIHPNDGAVPQEALDELHIEVEPVPGSMRVYLNGNAVSEELRSEEVGIGASVFSTRPEVRKALLEVQRSAADRGDVVAEGRDMGTVVFPGATLKFFLTADLEERSKRRHRELVERHGHADYEAVKLDMVQRDDRDRNRAEAPLVPAEDAIVVDTTALGKTQVINLLHESVRRRLGRGLSSGNGRLRAASAAPHDS